MSVGVWLDSNGPLVDKVADLSHQGINLLQAENLLTHGLEESLLYPFHYLDHDLSSSILMLRVRHDEQPIKTLVCSKPSICSSQSFLQLASSLLAPFS